MQAFFFLIQKFTPVLQRFMRFMLCLLKSEWFMLPVNVDLFYFNDVCFYVSVTGAF